METTVADITEAIRTHRRGAFAGHHATIPTTLDVIGRGTMLNRSLDRSPLGAPAK